jgi:hypothetical protein
MALATEYAGLIRVYRKVERAQAEEPRDGLGKELQDAARRITAFEHHHELPRLRSLIAAHGEAVGKIESAQAKLDKLERAIHSQELFISQRFADNDVISDTIELLAQRESALLGAKAVARLIAIAAEIEVELKTVVKAHPGASDCLSVAGQWDAKERADWSWMQREFSDQEAA